MEISLVDALALNRKISRIIATADRDRRMIIKNTPMRWWQHIFTTREAIAESGGKLSAIDDIIHKAYQWTGIYSTLASGSHRSVRVDGMEMHVFKRLKKYADTAIV